MDNYSAIISSLGFEAKCQMSNCINLVYLVGFQGGEYILKMPKPRDELFIEICQHHLNNEKIALEKAKDIEGITHLYQVIDSEQINNPLLEKIFLNYPTKFLIKEYVFGQPLKKNDRNIDLNYLKETITNLHNAGISRLDLMSDSDTIPNLIIEENTMRPIIIDLGFSIFRESDPKRFEKEVMKDWTDLEKILH